MERIAGVEVQKQEKADVEMDLMRKVIWYLFS